jgi:chromosome segregation ATPase
MALESPTERINKLERVADLLDDRLNAARKEIEAANGARAEVAKDLAELRKEFGELKTRCSLLERDAESVGKWRDDLKRQRDEWLRRMWAFGPNIVAAIISSITTLFVLWLNKPK